MGIREVNKTMVTASGKYNDQYYKYSDYCYFNSNGFKSGKDKLKYHITERFIPSSSSRRIVIGGIDLGHLPNYLFVFADGSKEANWQGDTKGYVGNIALNGHRAKEKTVGKVPYGGTIYTSEKKLGEWSKIIKDSTQAWSVTDDKQRLEELEADILHAFQQINALPATPGFESRSSASLDGLNTKNGKNEVYVINITSGFDFSSPIRITGDAGDVFIFRWDTDANNKNGYQGQVKPQSGGAFIPLGELKPSNFIHVAGDINASGGGKNPASPFPQGPRVKDGQGELIKGGNNFNGGGFFTGYWLTTGKPTSLYPSTNLFYGESSPLSNGIFVGGWYTITNKFSLTSGTSGVYIEPNQETEGNPSININKLISIDDGKTWEEADTPPGLYLKNMKKVQFKFLITNDGVRTLTDINVEDNVIGSIGQLETLLPGESYEWIVTIK